MGEQAEALKERARRFALATLRLIKHLPAEEPGPLIRRQLAKSATSVSMNYRATCRARSHAEFTSKIGLVAEKAEAAATVGMQGDEVQVEPGDLEEKTAPDEDAVIPAEEKELECKPVQNADVGCCVYDDPAKCSKRMAIQREKDSCNQCVCKQR